VYKQYSASFNKKPSSGKTTLAKDVTLADIPWTEAEEIYQEAYKEAKHLATKAHHNNIDAKYKNFIKNKVEEWEMLHPEQSFEGDMEAEHPHPGYDNPPGLDATCRIAGQRAYIEKFVCNYALGSLVAKVLPEIVELIGTFHVTRNSEGLVSGLQFCKDHFNTPQRMGIHRLLTLNSKSDFLEKQYKGDGRYYCALVPIIMYAIRKAKNIQYSEWDRSEIKYVMHSKLAEAMLWEGNVPDNDTLLADRTVALTVQSGAKIGTVRDPVSTYRLFGTTDTCYEGMPEYVGVMLSQIWCAHPVNRHRYMVLDPINWDNVPVALVQENLLKDTKVTKDAYAPAEALW